MRTIKQLADMYGVSDTAIRKRLKSLGVMSQLKRNSEGYIIPENIIFELDKIYNLKNETNQNEPNRTLSNQNELNNEPNRTLSNQNELNNEPNRTLSNQNEPHYIVVNEQKDEFKKQIEDLKQDKKQLSEQLKNKDSQIIEMNQQINNQKEIINKLQAELTSKNEEIAELKITTALYEKLKEDVEELKADKSDLQKHRDNLTAALTISKSDLARLENIVTQLAAMPLRTRVFGWSGAVAQLTMVSGADEIFVEETLSENTENN